MDLWYTVAASVLMGGGLYTECEALFETYALQIEIMGGYS